MNRSKKSEKKEEDKKRARCTHSSHAFLGGYKSSWARYVMWTELTEQRHNMKTPNMNPRKIDRANTKKKYQKDNKEFCRLIDYIKLNFVQYYIHIRVYIFFSSFISLGHLPHDFLFLFVNSFLYMCVSSIVFLLRLFWLISFMWARLLSTVFVGWKNVGVKNFDSLFRVRVLNRFLFLIALANSAMRANAHT